ERRELGIERERAHPFGRFRLGDAQPAALDLRQLAMTDLAAAPARKSGLEGVVGPGAETAHEPRADVVGSHGAVEVADERELHSAHELDRGRPPFAAGVCVAGLRFAPAAAPASRASANTSGALRARASTAAARWKSGS